MTDKTSPDILDLAEAVARDDLYAADAERGVRAATGSGPASDKAVRELRDLIAAASAVQSHVQATRDAAASESIAIAPPAGAIGTVIAGPVRAGAARRHSSNGGESQPRRRTWLLAVATLLVGTGVIGAALVGGGLPAPTPAPSEAPVAVPARAPSWSVTGSMIKPRSDHTATLLPDGKVLVAGGQGGDGQDSMASAELYDPGSGTWTATGSMGTPRSGHTATLLHDGKVLVTGGQDGVGQDWMASAELYDPGRGTWTATGSMGTPRSGHTATLLLDGKVLVAGGVNSLRVVGGINDSAELYDPVTGTWTAAGSMSTPRYGHAAALLPDGKVLVAGGADSLEPHVSTLLDSAELYDPVTGTWTATETMVTLYNNQAAAMLADGEVLVGGFPPELYDPVAASWTATRGSVISGWYGPAALLADGRVFVLGAGTPGQDVATDTVAAVFDRVTGSWTAAGKLDRQRLPATPAGNFTYTATLLPDGEVLVVGGLAPRPTLPVSMASAELYDPGSGTP